VFLCLILFHLDKGFRLPLQIKRFSSFQRSNPVESKFSLVSLRKPLLLSAKSQNFANFQNNDEEDDYYSRKQKSKQLKAPEKKAVSDSGNKRNQESAPEITSVTEFSTPSTGITPVIAQQGSEKEKKPKKEAKLSYHIQLTKSVQPTYAMMSLQNVELSFGGNDILKNASFSVSTGERVGLVGPNGIGKVSLSALCLSCFSYLEYLSNVSLLMPLFPFFVFTFSFIIAVCGFLPVFNLLYLPFLFLLFFLLSLRY
jgi:ABC-type multidrug transport system fused ATPase/permease subunit